MTSQIVIKSRTDSEIKKGEGVDIRMQILVYSQKYMNKVKDEDEYSEKMAMNKINKKKLRIFPVICTALLVMRLIISVLDMSMKTTKNAIELLERMKES